jgi:hypothetical protein
MDWRRLPGVTGRPRARAFGLTLVAVAGGLGAAVVALPFAVRAFVRALEAVMTACVWVAMSINVGVSVWSLLGSIGRASAAALVTRQGSAALAVLMLVAAVALYGLQRLLGSKEESSR